MVPTPTTTSTIITNHREDTPDPNELQRLQQEEISAQQDSLVPEQRMELDRHERDAFAKRLLEKDLHKQQPPTSNRSDPNDPDDPDEHDEHESEERRIRNLESRLTRGETVSTGTDAELTLEQLREESRRAYLKKRTERELTLVERELKDEEELFGGTEQLTEQEREEIRLKREILDMVKGGGGSGGKSGNQRDGDDGEGYRLPDDYEGEREGEE